MLTMITHAVTCTTISCERASRSRSGRQSMGLCIGIQANVWCPLMSPLSKGETGLACSGLLAFLRLALCRPISLAWLGIETLSISSYSMLANIE